MTNLPDPTSTVTVDATSLRGLAHPLRLRLLALLRESGPSTATALAARVGQSSGVTSYHLRQLAAYGFVEEDVERGNRRERWWRAAHRTTHFDLADTSDPETRALGEEYLRRVAWSYSERMGQFLEGLEAQDLGPEWAESWTLSDDALALTAAEAHELVNAVQELFSRYTRAEPGAVPAGRRRVIVQYQVLPQAATEEKGQS